MTPTPTGQHAATAGHPSGLSVRDFLTDGSLSRLCRALERLVGVGVQLRDEAGNVIEPGVHGEPWRIVEPDVAGPVPDDADRVPLTLDGRVLGALVVLAGEPLLDADARHHLLEVTRAVRTTAVEVIGDVVALRNRVKELGVLHRLSSMLASPRMTPELMLDVALESLLDLLGLDAGSVVLLPEDAGGVAAGSSEAELVLKASRNLSADWLHSPLPLSRDRVFDRLVLGGEILAVEDLLEDDRVLSPSRCVKENVRSFASAAMLFRERAIGVIRLYGRRPRRLEPSDRLLLRSIAEQAAAAVQQARLLRAQQEEQRIQRQLRLASAVQSRMLPSALPRPLGVDIAARSEASTELAGDFYDAFMLEGRVGLLVGDVVGKGVAAALMMSAVRASLRAYAHGSVDVDEVMTLTNQAMCRDTLDNEFATLWYGVLDPLTGAVSYASAGHDPPFVVRVPRGRPVAETDVRPLGVGGLVLGVDPTQKYAAFRHTLEPGDVLIAYTDGVTDARNFNDEKFGWSRLIRSVLDLLRDEPDAPAERLLDHVLWDVRRYVGLRQQVDDETLLVVRYRGSR